MNIISEIGVKENF